MNIPWKPQAGELTRTELKVRRERCNGSLGASSLQPTGLPDCGVPRDHRQDGVERRAGIDGPNVVARPSGWIDTCGPPLTPCPEKRRIALRATTQRPAEDDRQAASEFSTDVVAKSSNTGATQEPGENLTCAGSPFAATILAPLVRAGGRHGDLQGRGDVVDTVLTVYRADSGARLACNDDAPGQLAGRSELDIAVSAGEYLIQVGAHGTDGSALGQGSVTSLVTFVEDAGRGDPSRRDRQAWRPHRPGLPGTADVKRTTLTAGIFGTWTAYRAYTRFDGFAVNRAPAGLRITVTCRGRGCPLESKSHRRPRYAARTAARAPRAREAQARRDARDAPDSLRRRRPRGPRDDPLAEEAQARRSLPRSGPLPPDGLLRRPAALQHPRM